MLPRISRLKRNESPQAQIDYITTYLTNLVDSLEKELLGRGDRITKVYVNDKTLYVEHKNGNVEKFNL